MVTIEHDDLCPCARFHLQPEFCTCGAASCEHDINVSLVNFGLRLKEINSSHPSQETGWVIERGGSEPSEPRYWAGPDMWSQDHMDAIRFTRKIDAERVSAKLLYPNNRVCEHMWGFGPVSPTSPDARQEEGESR